MKKLIVSAGAALTAASPAHAQGIESTTEHRLMVSKFADCAIEAESARAESFVLDGREAEESLRRNREAVVSDCLPVDKNGVVTIRTRPSLIRYAFAEALIRKEPSLTLADPTSIAPLDHGIARGDGVETKRANIAISRFGECVVRASPTQSSTLLGTDFGSDPETAAIEALKPAVSACLPPGQSVALPVEMLRGTIALNYYRLAKSSRLQAAAQLR